jgi:hypothetical protein
LSATEHRILRPGPTAPQRHHARNLRRCLYYPMPGNALLRGCRKSSAPGSRLVERPTLQEGPGELLILADLLGPFKALHIWPLDSSLRPAPPVRGRGARRSGTLPATARLRRNPATQITLRNTKLDRIRAAALIAEERANRRRVSGSRKGPHQRRGTAPARQPSRAACGSRISIIWFGPDGAQRKS